MAPLAITGAPLEGTRYALPVASAQVKSALLLAGLYAEGETTVIEPSLSRDHTERMLRARGIAISTAGTRHTVVGPAQSWTSLDVNVPGDPSSAAFFVVAGLLANKGELVVHDVDVNPTRTGLFEVLRAMGAFYRATERAR